MAERSVVSARQRRALAALSGVPAVASDLYLAGGVAVAIHLGHRTSLDLDFFSRSSSLDLDRVQAGILTLSKRVEVIGRTDVALHLRFDGTDLDVVRYPYAPLVPPRRRLDGLYVAGLRDLAAMKLSAIATRGIRRDFWDLHAILASGRVSVGSALADYERKFGVTQSDVYHVLRALAWFEDAERDTAFPRGLTARRWRSIRQFFEVTAEREIARRARLAAR